MANDRSTAHDHVIAVRIELWPENLHICDTETPECSEHVSYENMLDDAFA